ncbi:exosome complex RNA-binding protein Rrp4 [Nanoarchaeota archaeon]
MSELLTKDRDIVVPGEKLAAGMDYLPSYGTYRLEDDIRAGMLGLVKIDGKVIKLIPMSGAYSPKRGDTIVCKVSDVLMSGWRVKTNSPYTAVLSLAEASSDFIPKDADLTRYFAIGDYLAARITRVTSQKLIDVSTKGPGLRRLRGGRILSVNTHKVPRIIGKQGSMVSMIKKATGAQIIVGQNGWIWFSGEPEKERIVVDAIKMIEKKSHLSGLTDKVKDYLIGELKKLGEEVNLDAPLPSPQQNRGDQ